jgi:hypothetical protein
MVAKSAPEIRRRYSHVPLILAGLLQDLGLERDAALALDALGPSPAIRGHQPS